LWEQTVSYDSCQKRINKNYYMKFYEMDMKNKYNVFHILFYYDTIIIHRHCIIVKILQKGAGNG
jgi:hypothetical protein